MKIFHINMLKKWNGPEPEEHIVNLVIDEPEEILCYQRERQEISDATYGEELTPAEINQMKTLIRKFRTVTNREPGRTSLVKHKIITSNMPAIRQRPRRMVPDKKKEVMEELKALLETGIVEESSSAWASPIVMVAKKDGSNRICVDYRKLNAESKFDAYPMPRIDEMLDTIGRARYLTTIDLAKGYWQVPMEPEDREKTAFTSPLGLLQFTVMPFGLSGAPATFQRLMDNVLRGTEEFAGVYLDDIVVHSTDWKDHLDQVGQVLDRLKKAGLTIKLKKCCFGVSECTYLGHEIGGGGVRPATRKIEAVKEMPQPKTKKKKSEALSD